MTSFEQWFSSDWRKLLDNITPEPGILSSGFTLDTASWDRRAAFLLWDLMGRPRAAWREQMAPLYDRAPAAAATTEDDLGDLLGDVAPPKDDLAELLG